MTRPDFLTSPGAWIITKRTSQPANDEACAVTRYDRSGAHPAEKLILGAAILAALLALAAEFGGWL